MPFVSTTAPLLGDAPEIDEHTLPALRVPCGASKLAAEAYCQAYAGSFVVARCVLRLTNVYGRGSAHKTGAVGRLLADGLTGARWRSPATAGRAATPCTWTMSCARSAGRP